MERGDCLGEQGKGFKLADSSDEAYGSAFRAGKGNHIVKGED